MSNLSNIAGAKKWFVYIKVQEVKEKL
jgi:hypothetical protein